MTDIVERLRGTSLSTANSDYNANIVGANMQEAADEIERLRQQNAELLGVLKDMSGAGYAIVSIYRAAIAKATGGE